MLDVHDLCVHYGRSEALHDVTLSVERSSITSVIGLNGAGKTSLLRALSGLERISSGTATLEDREISNLKPWSIARLGMAHVPAGRQLFPNMPVETNLRLGAYPISRGSKARASTTKALERVLEIFPELQQRTKQLAGTLSGGEQQMVAIGRALMLQPSILLMDEPSLGLAPQILDKIFLRLSDLNQSTGLTIVLVEQNAHLALDFADYTFILDLGKVRESGQTESLRARTDIQKLYFGMDPDTAST